MGRSFATALVRFLRRIVPTGFTNRYRPERHYMRGPGPKSHGQDRGVAVDGKGMAASLGSGGKSPAA
jgi:hypothetical protein